MGMFWCGLVTLGAVGMLAGLVISVEENFIGGVSLFVGSVGLIGFSLGLIFGFLWLLIVGAILGVLGVSFVVVAMQGEGY